jgi:uncharacterized membrane protein YcaP (DUF421 family)
MQSPDGDAVARFSENILSLSTGPRDAFVLANSAKTLSLLIVLAWDDKSEEGIQMPEWFASPKMWHDIFAFGVPVAEKILRPALVYIFLVVALRVFGKRELAQLNPFDLVVLLSLSNTVQNAIIGNDNSLSGGIIGALALLAINYTVVRFLFGHRRLDQIFEGDPTTLIEGGRVNPKALAKELLTTSELMTVLHRQGFQHVKEVERCVLEPGGTFDIKGKTPGADERSHAEVMRALEVLTEKVNALATTRGPA